VRSIIRFSTAFSAPQVNRTRLHRLESRKIGVLAARCRLRRMRCVLSVWAGGESENGEGRGAEVHD
jgi:hypothetical protein